MNLLYISQAEVDSMISVLIDKIKPDQHNFDMVVGIANGGLHVSVPVAKGLHLPHDVVRISFYDGMSRRSEPIISYNDNILGKRVLVVDDLVDGGHTLLAYMRHFGYTKSAVLFWNPSGYEPSYWAKEKPEAWLVFEWEENYNVTTRI